MVKPVRRENTAPALGAVDIHVVGGYRKNYNVTI